MSATKTPSCIWHICKNIKILRALLGQVPCKHSRATLWRTVFCLSQAIVFQTWSCLATHFLDLDVLHVSAWAALSSYCIPVHENRSPLAKGVSMVFFYELASLPSNSDLCEKHATDKLDHTLLPSHLPDPSFPTFPQLLKRTTNPPSPKPFDPSLPSHPVPSLSAQTPA